MPTPLKGALPRLDLGRLPIAGPLLIGREAELARLDAAWESAETHVLTFVAFGGMGKSALVSHWLGRMAADNWRGARRVLDWSFYSQGTEERGASADRFLDHALTWFGDPNPGGRDPPAGPLRGSPGLEARSQTDIQVKGSTIYSCEAPSLPQARSRCLARFGSAWD